MNKHTPGPWGIEQTDDTNWIGPLRVDGKINEIVASTDRKGLRDDIRSVNDANALLMAASPDLLTVALDAVETIGNDDWPVEHEPLNDLYRKFIAVIAKAKGGTV